MSVTKLPELQTRPSESLVDAIYASLRDAIIRGELPAGFRLREIELSRHFDVSTTPVRSALHRLDFEGLADISPRRGAVVAAVDSRELGELYELRELLECHALQKAAGFRHHDLSELESLLENGESAVSDGVRFNDLDLAFHACLTRLGGNDELAIQAQQIHRRIQAVRMRYAVALPGQTEISQREHVAMVEAFKAGDTQVAVERLRQHITAVRDSVLELVDPVEG